MKVAFVQFEPTLGRPDRNREAMRRIVPRAEKADLVVLPELASSGYNFADEETAAATAEPADGETTAVLAELCRRHDLHVVCGLNERDGEHRYNSAVVVGPQGLVGTYRKNHLFARETLYFRPGDLGYPTFRVGGIRLGVLVCYDWFFPESWTLLMRAGADVVAHPANLVKPGMAQRAVPAMAMMHRFYVVTANRIGVEGDLRFTGGSLVAGPGGDVLADAPAGEESLRIVEIDLRAARDKQLTPWNHLLRDRRPRLYEGLCAPLPAGDEAEAAGPRGASRR